MRTIEADMKALARMLEPTPIQMNAVNKAHLELRNSIRFGELASEIVDDYIGGSYGRGTSVRSAKGLDIVVLIGAARWGRSYAGPGSAPRPSTIVDALASTLGSKFKVSEEQLGRGGIRVRIEKLDVYCIPAIPLPRSESILFAGRQQDEWVLSSPADHLSAMHRASRNSRSMAKPAIRVLKNWNGTLPYAARWPSFAIESIVVSICGAYKFEAVADIVFSFFDFIASLRGQGMNSWPHDLGISLEWFGGLMIPDAGNAGNNVASGIDVNRVKGFQDLAVRSRDQLQRVRAGKSYESVRSHFLKAMNLLS